VVACIAKGTVVHADEAASWDNLHERFEVERINHPNGSQLEPPTRVLRVGYSLRLWPILKGARRVLLPDDRE
jgi:hypothetical protein